MTPKQAKNLINQVAQEYLGEHWKNKLTSIQCQIWEEVLVEWDFDIAKTTVRQMFINKPAYKFKEIFKYSMPDVDILENYYESQLYLDKKYCPCCSGDGWIHFESDGKAHECEHGAPPSEEPCNNFNCQPRKDSPCPMGIPHYNAKKVESMNRIKEDPNYKLGLTFLKKGGEMAESMAQQVCDIPEPDEEKIPF